MKSGREHKKKVTSHLSFHIHYDYSPGYSNYRVFCDKEYKPHWPLEYKEQKDKKYTSITKVY